jgi:hypothetical protein
MEIKCNRLKWKAALVAGLFLNCGVALDASSSSDRLGKPLNLDGVISTLPCFDWVSGMRETRDTGIFLAGAIVPLLAKNAAVASYIEGKNYNPNYTALVGLTIPIIFLAASVSGQYALENHPLKKLLGDPNTVVNIQLSSGDTPLHIAAGNSLIATELLLNDGRLDVNEHNDRGETPLYVAMRYNRSGSHTAIINILLNSLRFLINSRDNHGRTMLHIAVMQGDIRVVTQLLALRNGDGYHGYVLDVNIRDDMGRTPADYLEGIDNMHTRMEIQDALAGAEATYGRDGNHIKTHNRDTGAYECAEHSNGNPVQAVTLDEPA